MPEDRSELSGVPEQPIVPEHTPLLATRSMSEIDANVTGSNEVEKNAERRIWLELWEFRSQLETAAKDTSFKFVFGEGFSFDAISGKITVDPTWYIEHNYTRNQIEFALLHEGMHLQQLGEDPQGYLNQFDDARRRATRRQPNGVEEVDKGVHTVFLRFNNCISDINVNSRVARQVPSYGKDGNRREAVESLYRDKLFKETDYRGKPLTYQFMNALLREVMLPDEPVQVAEKVRELLDKPFECVGQTLTLAQLIEQYFEYPLLGRKSQGWQGTERERWFVMERTLMPRFMELLEDDEKSGALQKYQPKPGDGGIGEGELAPNEKEEASKFAVEEQRNRNRSAEERASDAARSQFQDALASAGFSPEQVKQLNDIRVEVASFLPELTQLWHRLIQKSDIIVTGDRSRRHKYGVTVSVDDAIRQLPTIFTNPSRAEIMEQYEELLKRSDRPKDLIVHLHLDQSGSMDKPKQVAVQRIAYLLATSLENFRLERQIEGVPAMVQCEIWRFGSDAKLALPAVSSSNDRLADIARMVVEVDNNMGGTEDANSLEKSRQLLTPTLKERIAERDATMLVIEITDGETETLERSREIIEALKESGVTVKAIQILEGGLQLDTVSEDKVTAQNLHDKMQSHGTFGNLWGEDGHQLYQLKALKETLFKILLQHIQHV